MLLSQGNSRVEELQLRLYSFQRLTYLPSGPCKKKKKLAQRLKHLPAMRETWVQSLSPEDSLEKEMATHSSILAWRIPWTEEPGGLQSMGVGALMDRNLVVPRVRERKRLIPPGLRGKPTEPCSQGSRRCTQAPGALSSG